MHVKTFQRLDRVGHPTVTGRTATGRRWSAEADIDAFFGISPEQKVPDARPFACCRVSSAAQKPVLQNQKRDVCAARGLVDVTWVEEVGGGLDFGRPPFLDLMERVERGGASHLVVAHRDRLTRFGHPWFPRATMRVSHLGKVQLREAVPGVGGILGCRVSERRRRWFASFQSGMDWDDGERSDEPRAMTRAKARKTAAAQADVCDDTPPVSRAGPDGTTVAPARGRPERAQLRYPRPGTVGAADVGIVGAAVVSTDESARARHAGQRSARPGRHAAVPSLIPQRQRRLARSVPKAKQAAAMAARTLSGPATMQGVHRIEVRYSRRQERRSRAISRLVWAEADRRDDPLHTASFAMTRSVEMMVTRTLHRLPEAALGRPVGMGRFKADESAGIALGAPRFFPSSKRCAGCGAVNADLALSERSWACPCCGAVLDRDGNAAENLCRLGLAAVADGPVPDDALGVGQVDHGRARVGIGLARGPRVVR